MEHDAYTPEYAVGCSMKFKTSGLPYSVQVYARAVIKFRQWSMMTLRFWVHNTSVPYFRSIANSFGLPYTGPKLQKVMLLDGGNNGALCTEGGCSGWG